MSSPFGGPIALSLSGGGFRAAGFHLGVLTILHRSGLLKHTSVLSTASGGTLVGLRLLLGVARDDKFSDTYFTISRYLETARPIQDSLKRAAKERITLTQAFSAELNETLFEDGRYAVATMREIYEARSSFAEGSFNATTVRSGLPFRFSFSRGPHARVGHKGAHLPRTVAEELRVSDVAAASCAFPGVFEPLVIPDDFVWPDEEVKGRAVEALDGESYGLVDGGVHDNQGIDPMLLAAVRLGDPVGLFLVSDADRNLEAEEPRKPRRRRRFFGLKIRHLSWLSWLLILSASLTIGVTLKRAQEEWNWRDLDNVNEGIAYGAPIAFCLFALVLTLYARFVAKRTVKKALPHLGKRAWRSIRGLYVGDAVEAVQTRIRTLTSVASTAFPRRLRGLVYRGAWSEASLIDRRAAIQIYALSRERMELVDGLYEPTESVVDAAKRAMTMPTALHLESPDELNDLLIAGQATTIARLVEMLEIRFGPHRDSWPEDAVAMDELLRKDWDRINSTGAVRPDDR